MAITPPVIPFAPQGAAGVAAAVDGSAEGTAALPGGFLGMLGDLTASLATTATPEAVATTVDTLFGLVSKAAPPEGAALAVDTTDTSLSPEAAAAAMAVMAQMLAGTQAVAVQAVVEPPVPAPLQTAPLQTALPPQASSSLPAAPALTAALAQLREPIAADPLALDADAATDPTALAQQSPAFPLALLQPRQSGAQSSAPASAVDVPQDAVDAGDASGFQSLTAMLSVVARSDGAAESKPAAISAAPAPPLADGARLAALNTSAVNTSGSGDAAPSTTQPMVLIREPVGTAQWADSIGARLTMMATRGEQRGALRLSPEHLGPVEVQIRLQDDKASVWFGAQQADTRAALQDALPRLRELFAAQGMQLADAGVSREPPRQDAMPSRSSTPGFAGTAGTPDATELAVALQASAVDRHLGALDTYA